MSGTAASDAAQAAPTEPSATETDQPPAQTTASPPGTEQPPPSDAKSADDKPAPDPRDRAIRQLAFEQRETRRQLQAARDQLAQLRPSDPNAPPGQADIERIVQERVQAEIASRENAAQSQAWISKGNAAFPDFTERCNTLADMGAGENPAFMQAIGRIDDGHKVIADLASDPGEAARVLRLAPVDMALALAKISSRIAAAPPPAKPVSKAPDPIQPLATASRGEVSLANLDGDEFRRAWNKRKRG